MAVLVISLIVGVAAMAVILACLTGFSRALKHQRLSALLVRFEETTGRAPRGKSKTLVDFPPRESRPAKDPVRHRISSRAAALVGLAIVLGSRGVTGDTRAASTKPVHDPKLQRGEKTQVPGVQPLHHS